MDKRRRSKIARWVFYPLLIGSIVYLAITQNQGRQLPEKAKYNSLVETKQREMTVQEGDRFLLRFIIKNRGKAIWSSEGEFPCFFSYHLYSRENLRTLQYDNRRFPLPQDLEPGKKIEMEITVRAPIEAGRYLLQFDMVREGKSWFRDYGSRTEFVRLTVEKKEWPEDSQAFSLEEGKYTVTHSSRGELDKLLKIIRLTLGQNEVAFEGKTGKIRGFAAGVDYPQIWLRDANTILPASRYFYDASFLSSWLEEHLAFQKESGSLEDWIDSRGMSDKNTTETDQESSAVQAAYKIYEVLGPEWMEKRIAGKRIIDRLEQALSYVLENRWSDRYGLLTGAHTADWGDVDMVDADQQAIYTDERTHWTADIYDQSMFYQACLNLAGMIEAGEAARGNPEGQKRADFWKEKATSIKISTNKWLWQEDRGFYRIHIHLDDLEHAFDESDMFAMGGNVQAVLAGLADRGKSRRIIEEALRRQETYKISTISGTLLPPYPHGLFKHPLVDAPYEYQNGAQWDWFGGRLIFAMFENGFSKKAIEKLAQIVKKNLKNRGFFEWDSKEGIGKGSDFYAGSAGSLGKALVEGYFGIRLTGGRLSLEPKLGRDSARIHVYLPTNDRFIAYSYQFDEKAGRLTLEFNSDFSRPGRLRVLNPWMPQENPLRKNDLEVFLDGKDVNYKLEEMNQDEFISLETDFLHHSLEIIF